MRVCHARRLSPYQQPPFSVFPCSLTPQSPNMGIEKWVKLMIYDAYVVLHTAEAIL